MSADTPRYVVGRGKVYFSESGGPPYVYMAETPQLTLSVTTETVTLNSADTREAKRLCEVLLAREITGQLVTTNISLRHIAMFLGGELASDVEAGDTGETYTIDPIAFGVWYQLGYGEIGAPPWGHTQVTVTAAAEDPGGVPVALTAGEDYVVDAAAGLVQFLSSSSKLSVGDEVEITYDYAAGTDTIVRVVDTPTPTYTMLFVAENQGCTPMLDNRIILPAVRLSPSGDWSLKGDEYQTLTWDLSVMEPQNVSQSMLEVIARVAS